MRRQPPTSTLFPYTTLFRSLTLKVPVKGEVLRRSYSICSSPLDPEELKIAVKRVQDGRSEEHTSELQSREKLVCRLLLEKKKETGKPMGKVEKEVAPRINNT